MVEDLKQYVDSYAPSCTTSYTVLKLGCSIKTWMKFLESYNLENFNNKYCVIPHSTYSMARPITKCLMPLHVLWWGAKLGSGFVCKCN